MRWKTKPFNLDSHYRWRKFYAYLPEKCNDGCKDMVWLETIYWKYVYGRPSSKIYLCKQCYDRYKTTNLY